VGDFYPDPNRPGRWIYDENAPSPGATPPPTSMLPIVTPHPSPHPREPDRTVRYHEYEDHQLEQDDLSGYDREAGVVPTEKLGALDEVLIQPPQDPGWRP
jgi:hypothetical protein